MRRVINAAALRFFAAVGCLVLLMLPATAAAEGKDGAPFRQELAVGASMGMNFSSVSFVPKVQQGKLMGITAGATLRWITEKNLGLQAELNFSQQGWKEHFEEQPEYRYSRTLNYVELPFLTHIYFGSCRFHVFVNLGPKLGYMISEKTDSNLQGAEPNKNNAQHEMPVEKKFDWGLCGGPGLELRTGAGSFLLEGRYYYALGDIYRSQKKDYFPKSAAQVMSVKLTYLFSLWGR